ncbi:hypothetical protein [Agromyces sp. CCNWLW203]|uniref:hypothetical protein n=1 Tax=Agromyces sp. CCNWLW203 TaxID=3112842 RepID=UPI002F96C9DF
MNGLPVVGADTVHLDRHTFMWVQLTRFGGAPEDDRSAIASMIASPGYAFDYASPFDVEQQPASPPVHGRWWLSAIDTARFRPTTAEVAESRIRSWIDDQDWVDPTYRQPPDVHRRLLPVYDTLRSGSIYTLMNPGDDDIHDYGRTTGEMGFHEFVAIDRRSRIVHLVVASDD